MVFNVALALGHLPGRFKYAQVIMIPKKTNAVSVNEYRPISLLEVPGKLLERLLNDRVQQFLEDNNIFQDEQFGFRRFRGTQQAIAVAYDRGSQSVPCGAPGLREPFYFSFIKILTRQIL